MHKFKANLENIEPTSRNRSPLLENPSTTRLMKVHSPSTSKSPFRNVKPQSLVKNPFIPPSIMPRSPTSQITYFRVKNSKKQEDVLDETINKLNFLEQRIANIMEKNDQLRNQLKKTDNDSIDQTSYYISGPSRSRQYTYASQQITNAQSVKTTIHTTHSPLESSRTNSIVSKRLNCKTPSVGKFRKSQITISQELLNGRGKKIYENGFTYEGNWVDGQREGNGTLTDNKGLIVYQGQWQSDHFSGRGRFINQDWSDDLLDIERFKQFKLVQHQFFQYEGEFKEGQFHGQGVMTFKCQGEEFRFIGNFALDAFHGVGRLEQDGGILLQGKWIYGCFV